MVVDDLTHRGLQSGEREVAIGPALHWPWQHETGGTAPLGGPLYSRTARIAQPDHLRRLVESLARSVVERRPEPDIAAGPCADEELTMPAGNEQKKIREVDFVGQTHRQRMTFEMVDGKKWFSSRPSQAFCHHRTYDQTSDQTGPGGGGNAIDLSKRD